MGVGRAKINETPTPLLRHHQKDENLFLGQSISRKLTYETRGWNLVVKELSDFCRGVLRNAFTLDFLTIRHSNSHPLGTASPFKPCSANPGSYPFGCGAYLLGPFANHNFLGHVGISLQRFSLGFFIALLTAIPIGTLMGWNIFI